MGRVPGAELTSYFYPRTPCGVRRAYSLFPPASSTFLSTYPVRGTTGDGWRGYNGASISIHVPRAGYDKSRERFKNRRVFISIHVPRAGYDQGVRGEDRQHRYFYPRTPCGVRPLARLSSRAAITFLSTYPVRGTTLATLYTIKNQIFLSTYPVRGTTARARSSRCSR